MKKLLLILAILLFFSVSIYAQDVKPITEEQAIEIARQEAIEQGVPQEWFGGKIRAIFNGDEWFVSFDQKAMPDNDHYIFGNHYGVFVSMYGQILSFHQGR